MPHSQTEHHVAFHESGHFVAQIHLQPKNLVGHITIIPDPKEGSAGAVGAEDVVVYEEVELSDNKLEEINNEILCLLAGYSSEIKYDSKESHLPIAEFGAGSDFEKASQFCEIIGRPISEFLAESKVFVDEHWDEITALAEGLLVVKRMDGEEAEIWIDFKVRQQPITPEYLTWSPTLKMLIESAQ